ncbi:response regulator [Leptolyngbya sp. FACHB-321]|uniref:response regulator n=1 Tax=Leptolyngbya sp. FACHB-321 TaxID=2692807 RepID=UPI0016854442|nr:response regulator [Leptolyngbya sp. FACHB-321]MBD2034877.1 response regulator [Leptolyngbya sp. FACHB-321]
MKVLLIEDDAAIAELLRQSLTAQHYLVEVAADGQEGWDLAEAFAYDLILLDLMLPKLNGIHFCQRLRHEGDRRSQLLNHSTPILLMTAEDVSSHRVAGLDAGADDYIVKPFALDELLARVRALLRRGSVERSPLLQWGQLQLDPSACQASYNSQPFHLSSKEYSLLELFLRHPQRIFSHGTLVEQLWALENTPTENAVRAQIKGLRKRLKEVGVEDWLETVYGLGYRLKESGGVRDATEVEKGEVVSSEQPALPQPHPSPINTFWEEYRSQYCDRLSIIEQAIAALQTQTLSETLRQQAQREAHTLKGSLGLFNLDDASELSRQLEQLLKTDPLGPLQQAQLAALVSRLRQSIEQPLPQTASKPTARLVSSNASSPSFVLLQRSQLLLVDDDAQLLNIVQAMLQPWGFQIVLLSRAQQFWGTLEEVKPDLLLLDIEMSEVNGIDLCQAIRNDSRWDDLPILMISANNEDETIQRVFMAGADDYVSKPIRTAELVARVIRRLEHAMVVKKLRGLEQ